MLFYCSKVCYSNNYRVDDVKLNIYCIVHYVRLHSITYIEHLQVARVREMMIMLTQGLKCITATPPHWEEHLMDACMSSDWVSAVLCPFL